MAKHKQHPLIAENAERVKNGQRPISNKKKAADKSSEKSTNKKEEGHGSN